MKKTLRINKNTLLGISLSANLLLYCIFKSSLVLNFLSIILYLCMLCFFDDEYGILGLFFFAPWETFDAVPGISFLTVMELMLFVKTIIWFFNHRLRICGTDFIAVIVFLAYGYFSYRVTRKVTVTRMFLTVFFSVYLKQLQLKRSEEERTEFWRKFFLYICITAVLSSFYAYYKALIGTGTISRSQGIYRFGNTLGVDRGCILYCSGMIFPLYYLPKQSRLRKAIIAYLAINLLLTVSLTALATGVGFVIIYLFTEYKSAGSKRKIIMLGGLAVLFIVLAVIWNYGSGITAIDNVIRRAKNTIYYLQIGDYSKATTTRSDILEQYQGTLETLSMRERLLGTGYTNLYQTGFFNLYSHNTYLDFYVCFGMLTTAFIFLRKVKDVFYYKELCGGCFIQLILLAAAYLIPSLSVSMLAQGYFFYVLLI